MVAGCYVLERRLSVIRTQTIEIKKYPMVFQNCGSFVAMKRRQKKYKLYLKTTAYANETSFQSLCFIDLKYNDSVLLQVCAVKSQNCSERQLERGNV